MSYTPARVVCQICGVFAQLFLWECVMVLEGGNGDRSRAYIGAGTHHV